MSKKEVRIAIVGCGHIANHVHIPGLKTCLDVEVVAGCDTNEANLERTDAEHGLAARYTDYRRMLDEVKPDAIIVATPNVYHPETCMAAFQRHMAVLCEKPLANTLVEAQRMCDAADRSGSIGMVAYTYRFVPAMRYLKHLIDSGALGKVRHMRAVYLQEVPAGWLGWRSDAASAGSGTLGDIGSHLIDFAHYLVGDMESLCADTARIVERTSPEGKDSDVDDWTAFIVKFTNGGTGVFEATRTATGRGCGPTENEFVEINGDRATAIYSLQDPNAIRFAERGDTVRHLVPDEFLRVPGATRGTSPADGDPRVLFRYDQAFTFIDAVRGGMLPYPTFLDGMRCQTVLEVVARAVVDHTWETITHC